MPTRQLAAALLLILSPVAMAETPTPTPAAPTALRLPGEGAAFPQLLEWLDSEKPSIAAKSCKDLSDPKHTAALRALIADRAKPARLRARSFAPLARFDETTTATATLALRPFADRAEDPCVRRRAALFLNTVNAPLGTADAIRAGVGDSTPGIDVLSYRLLSAMPPGDASLADVARKGLVDARREVHEVCAAYLRRAKLEADAIRAEEARRFPRRGSPNPGRNARTIFLDRTLLSAVREPMMEWLDSPSIAAQALAINAAVALAGESDDWRRLMVSGDPRHRDLARRAMWANRFGASDADMELVLRHTPADVGVLTRRSKQPGGPDGTPQLVRMLTSPVGRVRENARSILIDLGKPAVPALEKLAQSKVVEYRMDASTILQQINGVHLAPSLFQHEAGRDDIDLNAAQGPAANLLSDALEVVYGAEGCEHLVAALGHADPLVIAQAASALRRAGVSARPYLFRIADAAGKMPAQTGMFAVAAVREAGLGPDQMQELLDGLFASRWDPTTANALKQAAADCVQPTGWTPAVPALRAAAERSGNAELSDFALRLLTFAGRGDAETEKWLATRVPAELPVEASTAAWGIHALGNAFAEQWAADTAAMPDAAARAKRFDILSSLGSRAECAVRMLALALAEPASSDAAAATLLQIGPAGLAALRTHLAASGRVDNLRPSMLIAPASLDPTMKLMLASANEGERSLAVAWYIERIEDARGALEPLWSVAMDEKAGGALRADAFQAIAQTGAASVELLPELEAALASGSIGVVAQTARILGNIGPLAVAHLSTLAAKGNDPDIPLEVRIACSDAAVKIAGEAVP